MMIVYRSNLSKVGEHAPVWQNDSGFNPFYRCCLGAQPLLSLCDKLLLTRQHVRQPPPPPKNKNEQEKQAALRHLTQLAPAVFYQL